MKGKRVSPAAAGALSGTPAGIIAVWLINAYVLADPMPVEVAAAVGSMAASCVGALSVIWDRFLRRGCDVD